MNQLPDLNIGSFLQRYELQKGMAIAFGKSLFRQTHEFDFDVYLPSRKRNLQRGDVWTLQQKQSLIESVILRRNIPVISAVYTKDDVYQIIDGKQRLSALIGYLKDEFDFCGYLYSELPSEYKAYIERHHVVCDRLLEPFEKGISDDEKIEWFRLINFAGTPQGKDYMDSFQ